MRELMIDEIGAVSGGDGPKGEVDVWARRSQDGGTCYIFSGNGPSGLIQGIWRDDACVPDDLRGHLPVPHEYVDVSATRPIHEYISTTPSFTIEIGPSYGPAGISFVSFDAGRWLGDVFQDYVVSPLVGAVLTQLNEQYAQGVRNQEARSGEP
jgi:hypothetical protein